MCKCKDNRADAIGVAVSLLCGFHCAITPLLPTFSHGIWHLLFSLLAVAIALGSIRKLAQLPLVLLCCAALLVSPVLAGIGLVSFHAHNIRA